MKYRPRETNFQLWCFFECTNISSVQQKQVDTNNPKPYSATQKMGDLKALAAAFHFRSPRSKPYSSPRKSLLHSSAFLFDSAQHSRLLIPLTHLSPSPRRKQLHLSSPKLQQFEAAVQSHLLTPKLHLRKRLSSLPKRGQKAAEMKEEREWLDREKWKVLRGNRRPRFLSVCRTRSSVIREWRAEVAERDQSLMHLSVKSP